MVFVIILILELFNYERKNMVKSTIQVLLRQDINLLGKNGDLIQVSYGYARNYLFPKQIAVPATKQIIAFSNKQKLIRLEQIAKERAIAENKKNALELVSKFTLRKKVGKDDLIFGIVTNREIAELISSQIGETIDKKNIEVPEIKTVGIHSVEVKFMSNISANIKLQVLPLAE